MQEQNPPIVLFIPALNGGGAQKVVVNLANALVDLTSHPIQILLVKAEGPFLKEVRPEVEVVDLNRSRTLFALFAIASYLRRTKPAALMSSMHYANIIASISWWIAGKPCKLLLREATFVRNSPINSIEGIKSWLYQGLMTTAYRNDDVIVANSKETAESLVQYKITSYDKLVTIGNPINIKSKLTQIDPQFLSHLSIVPYLCAVGRLSMEKGFDTLIQAFSQLSDTKLHLVILGEGPLRADLTSLAKNLGVSERVHLPGFVSHPEAVIYKAKLFVLSSRWEGFGNVIVEALATGVPIVATDCQGAPADILLQGELGHLVPPNDPDALSQAINEALEQPKGTIHSRQQRALDFESSKIAQRYLNEAFGLF